ncbi:MAG: CDP-glycerol glycerophosphotransferase family protein, partial [Erysipelotrichaceae bacterium]|nr:CDP-glycerol glycerophosphotransferase family protein [Erysipelotrichaceae bacterium]
MLRNAAPEDSGGEGKKIVLYAPTYRGIEPNRVAPDALDFQKLYDGLHEDYILIIKHHQTLRTWPKCPDTIPEGFCYDFSKDKDMDINALLTVTDILITDYSSLVFDYAFFARPILFFTFDEELYGD